MFNKEDIKFVKGKGYKYKEVDDFIDMVSSEIEKLEEDNKSLTEEVALSEKKYDSLMKMYEQLKDKEEQRNNELSQVVDISKKIAENIVKEAEEKAQKISEEAEEKINDANILIEAASLEAERRIAKAKKTAEEDLRKTKIFYEHLKNSSAKLKRAINQISTSADQIEVFATDQVNIFNEDMRFSESSVKNTVKQEKVNERLAAVSKRR